MHIDTIVEELKLRYGVDGSRHGPISDNDIEKWSDNIGLSGGALYDALALRLADGFHRSEYSFGFCDMVVNYLFARGTLREDRLPDLFMSVFLAFDSGEFYHDNNREEDPVEMYTRPQLADILRAKGRQKR